MINISFMMYCGVYLLPVPSCFSKTFQGLEIATMTHRISILEQKIGIMVETTTLHMIGIFLAVLIAVVPLWYPRYSCFYQNAISGLDQLRELTGERSAEGLEYFGSLEEGERGFSEVAHTIQDHTHITEQPVNIELVHKYPETGKGIVSIDSEKTATKEQAIVIVEYKDGETEQIIDSPPFEVDRVLDLIELQRWVKNKANRRSHYLTTVLAILWGSVSGYALI